ncbi:hypothetical protein D3C81_1563000 [compost metagenome]
MHTACLKRKEVAGPQQRYHQQRQQKRGLRLPFGLTIRLDERDQLAAAQHYRNEQGDQDEEQHEGDQCQEDRFEWKIELQRLIKRKRIFSCKQNPLRKYNTESDAADRGA